jgi:uncharacterized HAD superfamily protein
MRRWFHTYPYQEEREMRTLDIGVDLDGVVYDFVADLRIWIHTTTGKPLAEMTTPTNWRFFNDWGLSDKEFMSHYASGVNAGHIFRASPPYPGAIENMHALVAQGHRLHIITARIIPQASQAAARSTELWLADYEVPFTSLTITCDKHLVPTDVFLEDSDPTYDILDAAGSNPWLLDRPYNAHHPGRRVRSWDEFTQVVTAQAHA